MQKSGKVKLQLVAKNQWGTKVILPTIGETEVSAEGIIEIEDTVATLLLTQTDSYKLVEGNGTTVTEEVHAEKVAEEVKKESKEKETEKVAVKPEPEVAEEKESDGLEEMTLSELKEIAKESGFDEAEYKKFAKSKKLMINFLRKNA